MSDSSPADYRELRAQSGRLFYSQNLTPHEPTGYFRPRVYRPTVLRIVKSQSIENIRFDRKVTLTKRKVRLWRLLNSQDYVKRWSCFSVPTKETIQQKSVADFSKRRSRRWSELLVAPRSPSKTIASEMSSHNIQRTGAAGGGPGNAALRRPSLAEDFRTISANSAMSATSVSSPSGLMGDEKYIASGQGISMAISLAEPMLFLRGFDQQDATSGSTTMLRGSLILRVAKSAKIKTVYLRFRGKAETDWPEGIPPRKTDYKDTESIMNHTWPFFNAQFQTSEHGHGADTVRPLKGPIATTTEISPGVTSFSVEPPENLSRTVTSTTTPRETKRLSLQNTHTRSFGKGDNPVAQKGYRVFHPGDYIYHFELPIDSRLPESIDVELGRVKYELEAIVERSGAFRPNLVGTREVILIRAPTENSLETVEPIAISRDWEDQLHYDIVISGKSFPLGAQVPIAFKLTPLAKVQCHRIKVYITENIQYYTSNKRVHRMEPTRRLQLFEKRADSLSTSTYPGSSLRVMSGGGIEYDSREAAAAGNEKVARDMTNLLGNLEGEHNVGPTEMELNIQLPSCHNMMDKDKGSRLHFDTTYSNIQVNHWIKIVMRLSKPDAVDPNKRRHFEISIDSPFNILSCRATQSNICLPAYTSPESASLLAEYAVCGCPGAPRRKNSPAAVLPTLASLRNENTPTGASASDASTPIATPATAHVHGSRPTVARPIHLLRAPSFNPPAWSAEDPPPPLVTPPPKYETLVDGDPRSGLADYFARLADDAGEDDDGFLASARIDLPLTPGGRLNRSMDEQRTWLPVGGQVTAS